MAQTAGQDGARAAPTHVLGLLLALLGENLALRARRLIFRVRERLSYLHSPHRMAWGSSYNKCRPSDPPLIPAVTRTVRLRASGIPTFRTDIDTIVVLQGPLATPELHGSSPDRHLRISRDPSH
jgi:hypothetical protein